ncbi:hypothetical protein GKQ38_03575 [Candidatus Nanohaloarchaea archaeon]|nr:hypothetical protein GKQ38_03575 [Candidatus Nanohaloarchaea archaeon]
MREIQKYRYLFAALLTVLVFSLGILFSNFMDDRRSERLQAELNEDVVELQSQNLQLTYLRSNQVQSCSTMEEGLTNMIKDYNMRLNKVQEYQKNSIMNAGNFKQIKRRYVLSGLRYWMFVGELKKECDYNANTVLFFTETLQASECGACKRQGQQLSLLKQKYQDDLLIFSVPTSMDDGMVSVLKHQYNISEPPALVINREMVIHGYRSRGYIEERFTNSTGE